MQKGALGVFRSRAAWFRWTVRVLIAVGALSGFCAAEARTGEDCPLARQPYSTQTVLIDLMINPATRAVVTREMGPMLSKLPTFMIETKPPAFSSIITFHDLLGMVSVHDIDATSRRLNKELGAINLTPDAIRARCARYDETPPELPEVLNRPAVLVFEKITGFRDGPSVEAAHLALEKMAVRRGWTLFTTQNGAIFNRRDLARFDAVVWNNVSGDALTVPQEKAFKAYMEHGGGFAAFHGSGGDPAYIWDWYADTLLGARFAGHPMKPQFQTARVVVEDHKSSITEGLGTDWSMLEEWYSFKASPRSSGAHILATLDEKSYDPGNFLGHDLHMGDHPIAWTRCIKGGRAFYTAIGHRPESYSEPHAFALIEQGIAWAAGEGNSRCVDGVERSVQ